MESRLLILFPCSSTQAPPSPQDAAGAAVGCDAEEQDDNGGDPTAQPLQRQPLLGKGKKIRFSTSKTERVPKDADSSSSSSSPISSFRQPLQGGMRLSGRWRGPWASYGRRHDDDFRWEEYLRREDTSRSPFHDLYFSVKESITNIYGDKFECFTRNFEKSFSSTLNTLWLINETSTNEQGNTTCSSFISNSCDIAPTLGTHEPPAP